MHYEGMETENKIELDQDRLSFIDSMFLMFKAKEGK